MMISLEIQSNYNIDLFVVRLHRMVSAKYRLSRSLKLGQGGAGRQNIVVYLGHSTHKNNIVNSYTHFCCY